MDKNKLLGPWGEAAAAAYLRRRGYTILASGYRCRLGEIDLIARRKNLVVFCEVKTRKDDAFAQAREYVGFQKQRRLRATAQFWLAQQEENLQVRFDVLEIYAPQGIDTRRPKITHLEDAFQ